MREPPGEIFRVLRDDGSVDSSLDPRLPPALLRAMLEAMWKIRVCDERGAALQRQGRISFWGGAQGQEAGSVGACAVLRDDDWIYPALRESGAMLFRGVPLREYVAQWFGCSLDPLRGRQMPCHQADRRAGFVSWSTCVGNQIPQAVGAAWAARHRGHDRIVACFFGDGATSEADFHVGLNFAGLWKVPVVFLCQNNQWSISVPFERQTASETIAEKAKAYGFEGKRVDGNDVLAVACAVQEAAARARAGDGPTLLELLTWRMHAHSPTDDPSRYRDEGVTRSWEGRDPIPRFSAWLVGRRLWSDAEERSFLDGFRAELGRAIAECEAAPPPDPAHLFDDLYATLPPVLAEQRDGLLEHLPGART